MTYLLEGRVPDDDLYMYEQAYNYVLDRIRSGELPPGTRVPSEKELAERFGVSRITSKRALSMLAEHGVVERKRGTGTFVAQVVPSLDGLPAVGRTRARQSTGCLGFVLPDAADAYGLELLNAIEQRAAEHGYHLIVHRTLGRQADEERAVDSLVGDEVVDGLVVFPVHGELYNRSLLRLALERYPLVLVDRYLPGIDACAVHTDNESAARDLTTYLLDAGHEQLAFLSPPVQNTSSIEDRLRGFTTALTARRISPDPERCFTDCHSTLPNAHTATERSADLDAIRAFVGRVPEVTGFVACEHNIALLLWQVLSESGRQLDRYRIACFDSPQTYPRPPFVHIRQNQTEMGRAAVDLLVAQLDGKTVPTRTVTLFDLVESR